MNHTIEKTVARKVTDASGVGVKSNIVSAFGDREDVLCLTGSLMGALFPVFFSYPMPLSPSLWDNTFLRVPFVNKRLKLTPDSGYELYIIAFLARNRTAVVLVL